MIGKAHKKWQFESAEDLGRPKVSTSFTMSTPNSDDDALNEYQKGLAKIKGNPAPKPVKRFIKAPLSATLQDTSRDQNSKAHPNWASAEQSEEPTSAPHVKKIYSVGDYGKGKHQGNTISKSNIDNPLFQKGFDKDHVVATSSLETTKGHFGLVKDQPRGDNASKMKFLQVPEMGVSSKSNPDFDKYKAKLRKGEPGK